MGRVRIMRAMSFVAPVKEKPGITKIEYDRVSYHILTLMI